LAAQYVEAAAGVPAQAGVRQIACAAIAALGEGEADRRGSPGRFLDRIFWWYLATVDLTNKLIASPRSGAGNRPPGPASIRAPDRPLSEGRSATVTGWTSLAWWQMVQPNYGG
jgi:hypothetical protein